MTPIKKPPVGGLLIVVFLALSGCSVARKAALPDGSEGYVVSNCKSMSYCYNRAAKLCGGKYEIIDHGQEVQGVLAALETKYQMTIRCK